MRAPLYADPAGTDPLYDDPDGTNPLETDAEDYIGTGALATTATLAAAGVHGGAGTGALQASAVLVVDGAKDAGGTGILALAAVLAADGVAEVEPIEPVEPPLPFYSGHRRPLVEPARRIRRSGDGAIVIHPRLWAAGVKSSELDDELVLALTA